MELLQIKNLSFSYNKASEKALDDISLSIKEGEFVVVCGESGCGKSTLLRLLKRQLAPAGIKSGEILYMGEDMDKMSQRQSVCDVGFVMQDPECQIVTDKVWHELSFGLESLGIDTDTIRRRVAEISCYFGINDWYRRDTATLSGGQKQLVNLASVMVMQPKLLILDEPTGQLDPIAAEDFIKTLEKINSELGITILLVEHRLEDVYHLADKVVIMDSSKIIAFGPPQVAAENLRKIDGDHNMIIGLPSAVKIFSALGGSEKFGVPSPLSVREGKDFLKAFYNKEPECESKEKVEIEKRQKSVAVQISGAYFRYEKNSEDVLRNLDITIYEGDVYTILGGNGAGKTTALKVMCGLKTPYRGGIKIWGKKVKDYRSELFYKNVSYLPQNPESLFVGNTVREDLEEVTKVLSYDTISANERIEKVTELVNIEHLLSRHPYDLSGGEKQKAALAKILLTEPQIILLDEPSKGIDAHSKKRMTDIIVKLQQVGKTIIIVTHDIEFAASVSTECGMFFDGQIISSAPPKTFFSGNNYYTTAAHRMSRDLCPDAISAQDVIQFALSNQKG